MMYSLVHGFHSGCFFEDELFYQGDESKTATFYSNESRFLFSKRAGNILGAFYVSSDFDLFAFGRNTHVVPDWPLLIQDWLRNDLPGRLANLEKWRPFMDDGMVYAHGRDKQMRPILHINLQKLG